MLQSKQKTRNTALRATTQKNRPQGISVWKDAGNRELQCRLVFCAKANRRLFVIYAWEVVNANRLNLWKKQQASILSFLQKSQNDTSNLRLKFELFEPIFLLVGLSCWKNQRLTMTCRLREQGEWPCIGFKLPKTWNMKSHLFTRKISWRDSAQPWMPTYVPYSCFRSKQIRKGRVQALQESDPARSVALATHRTYRGWNSANKSHTVTSSKEAAHLEAKCSKLRDLIAIAICQRRRNDDKNNFWEVESKRGSAEGSERGSTGDPSWNFIVGLKHRKNSTLESCIFIVVAFFPRKCSDNNFGQLPPFHPPGGRTRVP